MSQARFSPRQLDAFVAVASLGSFSQAAVHLHLSPSAISSSIIELEKTLGFAVLERTTRKVALSPWGREFLPAAIAVQRQMRQAAITADDVKHRFAGVVRVAAPLAVASAMLPPIIASYRAQDPGVTVRILDTAVEWLADRVLNREADLALGPDRNTPGGVTREPLFPSPWVLWCSPAHPLAAKSTLTWRDLRDVDLCAAGHDHEESVAQMSREPPDEQRITPTQIVDNISTALGLAAANLAATVSPAYVEALAKPLGLVMRRILDPEVLRHVSLYAPSDRPVPPATEGFRQHVRSRLCRIKLAAR